MDALELARRIEAAVGSSPEYAPDFSLVTADGDSVKGEEAIRLLASRGPRPVVNALLDGDDLVYEWVGEGYAEGETWPAPGATRIVMDGSGKVQLRKDFGGYLER